MLRDRLARYCGVYLDDSRRNVLQAALSCRSAALGINPEDYLQQLDLSLNRAELQRLAELILNHETLFFRNRPHFEALRRVVLPELHQQLPPGAPIRMWSAGCSSGEEPYSLAITALEALGDPLPRPVQVYATDLSAAALERARAGVYRGRTLSNLSALQRARFFQAQGDGLAVTQPMRDLVRYEQRNLIDPFPAEMHGIHIVFCQNVTIYFQLDTCRDLMARIYGMMPEGGSLFLGFSETLWNIFDRFRWREVAGSFVYTKETQRPAVVEPDKPARTQIALRTKPAPRPHTPATLRFAEAEIVAQGRSLVDAGNAEAALTLFAGAPLAGRYAPQILALTARAHADRGDLDLAVAEARRALEMNPLTTDAYVLIGLIYARQGQPLEAIKCLERARYLDSQAPLISYHLAECNREAGRREAALREYRNTLRALDDHPPDQLLDGVAVAWLRETCRHYVTQLGS
ncbi:MAG: tetratricopeptide repeat protein [Oscillochloris sp.]|nr:tetratricopeptide repeat protein [Oscillochloris sp.]